MKTTYFGLKKYPESLLIQDQAYDLVKSLALPAVLGFEYYPVITLGKSAKTETEIKLAEEKLSQAGIEVYSIDRGGQATLHSPGQLIIYPIVPLKQLKLGVRDFVQILEEATMNWLQSLNVLGFKNEDTGVSTSRGKIAFIGLRVDRGITKHGIAININNDLSLFNAIRPCGLENRPMDSLYENAVNLDLPEAFSNWNNYFTERLLSKI